MTAASVSVERDDAEPGTAYAIKIASDTFEINVRVPGADVASLTEVRRTPWLSGSLRIGSVAEAPAWWSISDPDEELPTLNIVVGHDDQTWDLSVMLPLEVLDDIVLAVEEARAT